MSYTSQPSFKDATPITLSAEAGAETCRLINSIRGSSARVSKPVAADALNRSDLALHLYNIRRERTRLFDNDLFGEAAWDILLILYWAETEQLRLTVSNVCDAAGVPATTALRWITRLEREGTIKRTPHPSDGRIFRLTLSEDAVQRMNELLDQSLAMNFALLGSLQAAAA